MFDLARPLNDVVPLSPELLAKLDDVLGRYGYRLEDPSLARAVMRMMVLIGKPAFRKIASLERMGHWPERDDRAVLEHGDVVPIAFGWFKAPTRLGSERRSWHHFGNHPNLSIDRDLYDDNPQKAAAHDWMRMRLAGIITRPKKH